MSGDEHVICIVAPLSVLAPNSPAAAASSGKQRQGLLDTVFITEAEDEAEDLVCRRSASCSELPKAVLLSQDSDHSSCSYASTNATALHARECQQQGYLQEAASDTSAIASSIQQQQDAAAAAAKPLQNATEHKHHHKHKHRHRHHHHHTEKQHQLAEQLGAVERSLSAFELPSPVTAACGHLSRSNSPARGVEDRRPKSFTSGQRCKAPSPLFSHSSPGSSAVGFTHSALNAPIGTRPRSTHSTKLQQHAGQQQQQHGVANGRQSPLAMALLSKRAAPVGGRVGVTDGSFSGPPVVLACKPERIMSECIKPKTIARGFAGHWLSRSSIDVFTGSRTVAAAAVLRSYLPRGPGLHLWLVKAPRSRCWVPIHLAGAESLQSVGAQYLHDDGTCGPAAEPFKYKVFMDMMCRGFAVQLRFRPLKSSAASVSVDLLAKLRVFDFPLNDKDNGGCRPIELPNGWQVNEYPVMVHWVNVLFEQRFGPRRLL